MKNLISKLVLIIFAILVASCSTTSDTRTRKEERIEYPISLEGPSIYLGVCFIEKMKHKNWMTRKITNCGSWCSSMNFKIESFQINAFPPDESVTGGRLYRRVELELGAVDQYNTKVKVNGFLPQTRIADKTLFSCSNEWKEEQRRKEAEREEHGPSLEECIQIYSRVKKLMHVTAECRELLEK